MVDRDVLTDASADARHCVECLCKEVVMVLEQDYYHYSQVKYWNKTTCQKTILGGLSGDPDLIFFATNISLKKSLSDQKDNSLLH